MKVKQIKSQAKVILVVMIVLVISNIAYAKEQKPTETSSTGAEARIEYHTKAYEKYWDEVLGNERIYDENKMLIKENEVINSILTLEDGEELNKQMKQYEKLRDTKTREYEEIKAEKEKKFNDEINRRSDEITRWTLITALVSGMVLIIPIESESEGTIKMAAVIVLISSVIMLV